MHVSIVGLLTVLCTVTVAEDATLLDPLSGLKVNASSKGVHIKVSRLLPPPTSSTPTSTPTPTPASVTASSTVTPPTPAPTTPATPATPTTTDEILFYVAALREVDSDGVHVKQPNGVARGFSSLDTQDFNVTRSSTPMIPNSQPPVPADTLTFEFTLPTPPSGLFKIVASLPKANGNVTFGDEVMTLTAGGQLVVSAEVDGWQWCDGDCSTSSKPSMFLELDVVIQPPSGVQVKDSDGQSYGVPERYTVGKYASANFSTKVSVDHSWRNLTSGYPKLSTSDLKNTLTIRLPRFNTSAIYNMAFDPGYQPADHRGTVGGATAIGDVRVLLFVAVAMVATGFGRLA